VGSYTSMIPVTDDDVKASRKWLTQVSHPELCRGLCSSHALATVKRLCPALFLLCQHHVK
jgi:hypothetical protein